MSAGLSVSPLGAFMLHLKRRRAVRADTQRLGRWVHERSVDPSMKGKPYPPGFREDAVKLLRSPGRPLSEVASDLGIARESLRRWAKQTGIDEGGREGIST